MAGVTPEPVQKIENTTFNSANLYYGDFDVSKIDTTLLTDIVANQLGTNNNGITLKCSGEIHNVAFANTNEKEVAGFQRITKVNGEIEGEILVLNPTLLTMSLMSKSSTDTSTKYDKYEFKEGMIDVSQYKTLIMVAMKGKEPWIIVFNRTYNAEGFGLETTDGDEGKVKVKFIAAYDKSDLTKSPISIYIPKVTP